MTSRRRMSRRAHAETLAQRVLNRVSDGFVELDREWRYTYVNEQACRLSGRRPEDLLGRPIGEELPAGVRQAFLDAFERALAEQATVRLEVYYEHEDRWFENRIYPSADGLTIYFRDITRERAAEVARRESEARMRQALQAARAGAWDWDIRTGRVGWSVENFKLLGLEPGSVEPSYEVWLERVHPDDREQANRDVEEAVVNHRNLDIEYRVVWPDGTVRWIHDLGRTVTNSRGEAVAMYGIQIDVTVRKAADAQYRELIEHATYGIYASNLEGRFLHANSALAAILGYGSVEELLEVPLSQLYRYPEQRPQLLERYRHTTRWKGLEVEWKRKDGSPVTLRLSGRPLRDEEDQVTGFEVIAEDIDERAQLERQLQQAQKMEAVGRLAGGIAHDFNNLLTAILGYTELAAERVPAEDLDTREDLNEVLRAASRASELTARLLTFSRSQPMLPRYVTLEEVVSEHQRIVERIIDREVELSFRLAPPGAPIFVDPGQIAQVLMNLIVNARDAMPDGGRIEVETAHVVVDEEHCRKNLDAQPGPHSVLIVRDNGAGMDEHTRARIFEPFFTTKEAGKGTGLGLSTVYGIVRRADGHIVVDSAPGLGTTFRIFLPAAPRGAKRTQAAGPGDALPRGTETVLVVDDEGAIRNLGSRYLRGLGYDVIEASGSREALRLAERRPGEIHLLLTDVEMPELDGVELARRILAIHPEVKVLFATGYLDRRVEATGFDVALIQKPFTREKLAAAVREALGRADPGDERAGAPPPITPVSEPRA